MENMILIHNCETGEVTEIAMTAKQVADSVAEARKQEERIVALKSNKAALLERLGITADEAALLLG